MEIELVRIILDMPYEIYKSFNYVTNKFDSSYDLWSIYYRKSKKYDYIIRVQEWDSIEIGVFVGGYPLRIEFAPKYLVKIIARIASYLSVLGFPTKVYGL